MSFNVSGLFSPPAAYFPIVNGTLEDASQVTAIFSDMATGLSNTICKDGQTTITANIPLNGFKLTGVGAGTARTDAATLANVQDGTGIYISSVSGTNALTLLPSPAIASYATGQNFRFLVGTTNTGAMTVSISGLTAKPLYARNNVDCIAGDLRSGDIVEIYYDGSAGTAGAFILSGGGFQSQLTSQTLLNCTLTTSTVTADPTTALGIASKQYVDALWTTGDVKVTLKTTADTGWVMFDDGTIGSASSGATTRSNADTEALFTLIWNNISNINCAVSSGRGSSAAADFAANKTIALPKALGRALAVAGAGSGLTSRSLAVALGAEDSINVSHTHTVTDAGHNHGFQSGTRTIGTAGSGGSEGYGSSASNIVQSTSTASGTTGVTVATSGSSGTGANIPPSVFLNMMVKL